MPLAKRVVGSLDHSGKASGTLYTKRDLPSAREQCTAEVARAGGVPQLLQKLHFAAIHAPHLPAALERTDDGKAVKQTRCTRTQHNTIQPLSRQQSTVPA